MSAEAGSVVLRGRLLVYHYYVVDDYVVDDYVVDDFTALLEGESS